MFEDSGTEITRVPPELRLAAKNVTPTMTERLKREEAELKARLAEVQSAIQAIESNPKIQQVVDALTRLSWLR